MIWRVPEFDRAHWGREDKEEEGVLDAPPFATEGGGVQMSLSVSSLLLPYHFRLLLVLFKTCIKYIGLDALDRWSGPFQHRARHLGLALSSIFNNPLLTIGTTLEPSFLGFSIHLYFCFPRILCETLLTSYQGTSLYQNIQPIFYQPFFINLFIECRAPTSINLLFILAFSFFFPLDITA